MNIGALLLLFVAGLEKVVDIFTKISYNLNRSCNERVLP